MWSDLLLDFFENGENISLPFFFSNARAESQAANSCQTCGQVGGA